MNNLNESQKAAIEHGKGPALVVAGAGSGKTLVLTRRIAHLVNSGVEAKSILAITFTNKASMEMGDRMLGLVNQDALRDLWVMTFHRACVRILRENNQAIPYDDGWTIVDKSQTQKMFRDIIKNLHPAGFTRKPAEVSNMISKFKNSLQTPSEAFQSLSAEDHNKSRIVDIYREYQKRLLDLQCMDFDDLLMNTIIMLQENENILSKYQERFIHILVDEYQDTNFAQGHLIKLISNNSGNVFVVGDSDQSIYGFRGAKIENINKFQANFKDAEVYVLSQNYRSDKPILEAANNLISNNEDRHEKVLQSTIDKGRQVSTVKHYNDEEEANWIASKIEKLIRGGDYEAGDIAILYRVNSLSKKIEEALLKRSIKHVIVRGTKFLGHTEVRDLLAYLKFFRNPLDLISAKRALQAPKRGIGDKTIEKLIEHTVDHEADFVDVLMDAKNIFKTQAKTLAALNDFAQIYYEFIKQINDNTSSQTILNNLIERVDYYQHLEKTKEDEDYDKALTNIETLMLLAEQHPVFSDFLEYITLMGEADNTSESNEHVSLMTIHAAKGLEYPIVFFIGLEEEVCPHFLAIQGQKESLIEEERRLAYVGITRAKDLLFLSCAENRTMFGKNQRNKPSRFLNEIYAGKEATRPYF